MGELRALASDVESLAVLAVIGLAAGWLAGRILRGRGFGLLVNLLIGVAGSFLGGFLFRLAGLAPITLLGQLIAATVGAIALVWLINAVRR